MKKAFRETAVILKGILFIGFSVQVVLGLLWIGFQFPHLREYGQPDSGIWSVVRAAAKEVYPLVYLAQLALAACAGRCFLKGICPVDGIRAVWRVLVLLTFPMAAQCHMSVSPYSAAGSFFLLELAGFRAVCTGREKNSLFPLAGMGGCWLLLTLLLPEYLLLGAVPFFPAGLICIVRALKQHRAGKAGRSILILLAFSGILQGSCRLLPGWENPFGREAVALSMLSRVSWESMQSDSIFLPDEVRTAFETELTSASYYADNIRKVLQPALAQHYDEEERIQIYDMLIKASWTLRAPDVLRRTAQDILGYAVTPLLLPMQLEGRGYPSYSGRNYEMMLYETPRLTHVYVTYSCGWFCLMLVLALLTLVAEGFSGVRCFQKGEPMVLFACAGIFGFAAVLYTLRGAGVMDYKCTVAGNLFWQALVMRSMDRQSGYEVGEVKDGDVGNSDFGVVSAADCCSDAGRRNI